MTVRLPACAYCKWFWKGTEDKCTAFPQGIPRRYLSSKKVHYKRGAEGPQFKVDVPEETPGYLLELVGEEEK